MTEWIIFALVVAWALIGFIVFVVVIYKSILGKNGERGIRERQYLTGIAYIEEQLQASGFFISRKVGHFRKNSGSASFFLYVDDVQKKWVMTSPMDKTIDKIFNYTDLLAYDFFDNDDTSLTGKIFEMNNIAMQGFKTTLGAGIGVAVGGGLFGVKGALLGGAGMGMGFSKIKGLTGGLGQGGATESYGIIIKTLNTDVHSPVRVYDCMTINDSKSIFKKRRLERTNPAYVCDINTINEMGDVLDYIYSTSR